MRLLPASIGAEIMPKVSIIMPCRNGAGTVTQALRSLTRQTYRDIEILVLDDGSEDDSLEYIARVAREDTRVRTISTPKSGIVQSLNRLVASSGGEYIARMDADDIAHPERIEKQVALISSNPQIGIAGCWVRTFGQLKETWHCSQWDNKVKNQLLLGMTPLCHPTWLVRATLFHRFPYESAFEYVEDREWLGRIFYSDREVQFGAVPEILLYYRTHPNSVTASHPEIQKQKTISLVERLLKGLGVELPPDVLDFHLYLLGLKEEYADTSGFMESLLYLINAFKRVIPDEHKILPLRALARAWQAGVSTENIEEMQLRVGVSELRGGING